MQTVVRGMFVASGIGLAVLAAGYFQQAAWAVGTWPWPDGRLSNVFVSSMMAAVAAAMLWLGVSGRLGGAAGGFLHLAVILGGAASVLFPLASEHGDGRLLAYAIGCAAGGAACLLLFPWAHRRAASDTRRIPASMRAWFVVYVLILVPAGVALLARVPGIMPWPLKPETSMVYGWIFLAATCSFVYPLVRPQVEYAGVGLWGFLAYDLVLLEPFVQYAGSVKPEFRTGLLLYIAALSASAIVSLYYLFGSRRTAVGQ